MADEQEEQLLYDDDEEYHQEEQGPADHGAKYASDPDAAGGVSEPAGSAPATHTHEQATNGPAPQPVHRRAVEMKANARQVEAAAGPSSFRYFILRSSTPANLAISVRESAWATPAHNQEKLNQAYHSGAQVRIIYSVNGSNAFQGYAVMKTACGALGRQVLWDNNRPFGVYFAVDWQCFFDLPHSEAEHLRNPLNQNKPVHIARDGTELPPDIGNELVRLMEARAKAAGAKPPRQQLAVVERGGGMGMAGPRPSQPAPPPSRMPNPVFPSQQRMGGPAGFGGPHEGPRPPMGGMGMDMFRMGMDGPMSGPMGGGMPGMDPMMMAMAGGMGGMGGLGGMNPMAMAMGGMGGNPGFPGGMAGMGGMPGMPDPHMMEMFGNPMMAEAMMRQAMSGAMVSNPMNPMASMMAAMAGAGGAINPLMAMQQQQQPSQPAPPPPRNQQQQQHNGMSSQRDRSRSRSPGRRYDKGRSSSPDRGMDADILDLSYEEYLERYKRAMLRQKELAGSRRGRSTERDRSPRREQFPAATGPGGFGGGMGALQGMNPTAPKAMSGMGMTQPGGQPYTEAEYVKVCQMYYTSRGSVAPPEEYIRNYYRQMKSQLQPSGMPGRM